MTWRTWWSTSRFKLADCRVIISFTIMVHWWLRMWWRIGFFISNKLWGCMRNNMCMTEKISPLIPLRYMMWDSLMVLILLIGKKFLWFLFSLNNDLSHSLKENEWMIKMNFLFFFLLNTVSNTRSLSNRACSLVKMNF